MAALSRNAQVLRFLLEVAPGIGHIKLAKYAYLADLEALRYLGVQISGMHYVFDNFGPFDSAAFYGAKDELIREGYIVDSLVQRGQYVGHEMQPTTVAVEYAFTRSEIEVLRYVAQEYMQYDTRGLCQDIVYQTPPMKNAQFGQPLAMDSVKQDAADPLGFRLDRMLAGEASAADGRGRPLLESRHELRRRLNA